MEEKSRAREKIKVNVLSPGRFHLLDLSRELDKQGFDVKFYSFVPTKRAMSFGLPRRCSVSLVYVLAPFLALEKVIIKRHWATRIRRGVQDVLTGLFMRRSDVVIMVNESFVYAIKRAKKRGALIIQERGNKHILEQRRVLEAMPSMKGKKPVPDDNVRRELEIYKIADYISVGAQHVKDSFLERGFADERVFVDNYGVNVSMFKPVKNAERKYDVIMVGGWGYRKGCDLIVEAIRRTGLEFIHVGPLVDCPFPQEEHFTHVDPVDEKRLIDYYSQAKIFLLPSREEGLALVQVQAIACNLPLIGSRDSGALDLKKLVKYPDYITIVKDYTVDAVVDAIHEALANYKRLDKVYAGDAMENLTWEAYGKRYAAFLHKALKR